MYLLDISLQSVTLMVAMVLGIGLFVVAILLKTPLSKKSSDLPIGAGPQDASANFIELINQGNTMLAQYHYDKALDYFQQALRIKSDEPSVHFKIGRVLVQKEQYKNAATAFRNALNLNPSMVEAHYELARLFQLQNSLDQAHKELDQALKIKPEHEDTLRMKVKLFEQTQQYKEALPFLEILANTARSPMKYRTQLAEYLSKLDQPTEAISEYHRLIELDPANRLDYQCKIAQTYFEQQDYSKAVEYFKTVLQEQDAIKDPEYLLILKSQMAASLCNEGVKRFEINDCHTAINHYQEALLYDDANPDIHYNLGKALHRIDDAAKAIEHFQKAIETDPRDVGSYYEMAVLQDEKGMIPEAIINYLKVLELDPRNVKANFGLGTLYGVQGNMEQAIHYLSTAVALNSEYVDAIYNLGVALERKNELAKASKMYKKVLSLDPSHEKAHSNLAHLQHMKQ